MKKSKLIVSLMLVLLIVIQSMTAFAGAGITIKLGNVVVDSTGVKITGTTVTSYQSSVGQAVYYDINGTTSAGIVINSSDESVVGSVYTSTLDYDLSAYKGQLQRFMMEQQTFLEKVVHHPIT